MLTKSQLMACISKVMSEHYGGKALAFSEIDCPVVEIEPTKIKLDKPRKKTAKEKRLKKKRGY